MTRTRARADERNEKTDSITKERRRIRNLEMEVAALREWKDEREMRDAETEMERKFFADLLKRFAENLDPEDRVDIGEGLAYRVLLGTDLLRIAELLDPDDD